MVSSDGACGAVESTSVEGNSENTASVSDGVGPSECSMKVSASKMSKGPFPNRDKAGESYGSWDPFEVDVSVSSGSARAGY